MIRLVSLNIERSKHLDLVIPFLQKQNADVICIQELMEYDIPTFEKIAGSCAYTATTQHPAEGRPGHFGYGIFSRLPMRESGTEFYHGTGVPDRMFDFTNAHTKHKTESHAVSFAAYEKEGSLFKVATTHFTWTPGGEPDEYQREDLKKMLEILERSGEFVLTGDFNAPRGGEIFTILAHKYKDNIPLQYKTSIDLELHRAGKLPEERMDQKMVDGLFSTPGYVVSDVELHSGVSDHMAITATISSS